MKNVRRKENNPSESEMAKKKEEKRVKYIRERNLIKKEGKDERKISGQTLSRRGKNVEARKHFCRNKFN